MRQARTVAQADDRMHDRGRMDDDLDRVVRQVEEEVRLDQLEALVGQRRGVDGDLRPHLPGRVRERVRRRDVFELVARAPAEGTAAGREDESPDLVPRHVSEELERRRVLAVDRQQQPSAPRPRVAGELACGDEALLVRERERDAALERPERRVDAGEADDRVEDDVRLGLLEHLGRIAADLSHRREAVDRRRARGRGDQLEIRIRRDDLERLASDRAASRREPLSAASPGQFR